MVTITGGNRRETSLSFLALSFYSPHHRLFFCLSHAILPVSNDSFKFQIKRRDRKMLKSSRLFHFFVFFLFVLNFSPFSLSSLTIYQCFEPQWNSVSSLFNRRESIGLLLKSDTYQTRMLRSTGTLCCKFPRKCCLFIWPPVQGKKRFDIGN